MFSPTHKTFLQRVIEKELSTFTTVQTDQLASIVNEPFKDGNVLFRVPIDTDNTNVMLNSAYPYDKEGYNRTTPDKDTKLLSAKYLLKGVTNQVLTLGPVTGLSSALDLITTYRQLAGNNFYGAILRGVQNPDFIVNPLHILTEPFLLADDIYQSTTFTVMLYFYTDRESLDTEFGTSFYKPELGLDNVRSILQQYTTQLDVPEIKVESIEPTSEGITATYRESRAPGEDAKYDTYIVTHQLITEGIMAPYYGTSLLSKCYGQSTSGRIVSPVRSCNVGSTTVFTTIPNDSNQSVCTGSESNQTLEGLRTLTHANLSSPYNGGKCLLPGCLGYIDTMIQESINLYAKADIIPEDKTTIAPPPPFTDAELLCTTLAEFIKINADKLTKVSPLDLENKYAEMLQYKESLNEPEPDTTTESDQRQAESN